MDNTVRNIHGIKSSTTVLLALILLSTVIAGCGGGPVNKDDLKNYLLFQLKVPTRNLEVRDDPRIRVTLLLQPMSPEAAHKASEEVIAATLDYFARDKVLKFPGKNIHFRFEMETDRTVSLYYKLPISSAQEFVKGEMTREAAVKSCDDYDDWSYYPADDFESKPAD